MYCNNLQRLFHLFEIVSVALYVVPSYSAILPCIELGSNVDPPYYNHKVRSLKKKARRINANFKRTGLGGVKLREIKTELTIAKKQAKDAFMGRMFDEHDWQGSWNRMYRYLASQGKGSRDLPTLVDTEGKEWVTEEEKAETLNNFYGSVFNEIDSEHTDTEYIEEHLLVKANVDGWGRARIWDVLRKLKNGKSPGLDGIQSDFLKLAGRAIVPFQDVLFHVIL